VKLTTHLYLVLRSRTHGTIPSLPHMPSRHGNCLSTGNVLTLMNIHDTSVYTKWPALETQLYFGTVKEKMTGFLKITQKVFFKLWQDEYKQRLKAEMAPYFISWHCVNS